jgi:hypothetical protein
MRIANRSARLSGPYPSPPPHFLQEPVSSHMTTPAVTISVNAGVQEAADLMLARKIRRLPVVDDSGYPVGILSRWGGKRGGGGGAACVVSPHRYCGTATPARCMTGCRVMGLSMMHSGAQTSPGSFKCHVEFMMRLTPSLPPSLSLQV